MNKYSDVNVVSDKEMDQFIKLKIRDKGIKISILCSIVYLYICRSSFLVFARQFYITTLVGGVILIAFVGCLIYYTVSFPQNICWDGITIVLIAAAFFYITLLIHPEYASRYADALHEGRYSAKAIFKYGAGIYFYYIIRLFRHEDEEKLYKLYKVVAFTILFFDIWALRMETDEHRMTFGYQMEIAAIIFMMQYLRERKKKGYMLLSLFAILLGILYGSRAIIIGYVVFIVLYFFWEGHIDRRQGFIMALGVLAALAYSSQTVMTLIYNFFASHGIQSRTLYYIAQGDILAVDQARQNYIWPVLTKKIKDMPLLKMYGAFGDRYFLALRWPYSHNMVLEILLTFGWILGVLFLAWMVIQLIKVIRKNKDLDGLMTIAFGSFALCRLFFSSSFWMEPYFWGFIAMLVNCAVKRKSPRTAAATNIIGTLASETGGNKQYEF